MIYINIHRKSENNHAKEKLKAGVLYADREKVYFYISGVHGSGCEVKGAIPFGVALGLDVKLAYVAALLGSGVVVCFLAFITNWFYRFCKERGYLKRFIGWMDKITGKNRDKIQKYGPLAIFVYVAVPIPGTGTWTGSIIAGVINLRPRSIILSVFCGNMVSGLILALLSSGVVNLMETI